MSDFDLAIDGARCRIWPDGPAWDGQPAAAIGALDFESAEAGRALLTLARARLVEAGRTAVLAPLDGDTWHAYRAVVETDGSPPFALEPRSGAHDVAALTAAGFAPIAHYSSARAALPQDGALPDVPGITVRAWDGQGAEALLDRLFALAGSSFADKSFFKPIAREAFLALYRPLLAMIDPRLVLFAHDERGAMKGFLFGLPDVAQGAAPTTAILKTYASMQPGVGHLLAARFHADAAALGYTHVLHALMHDANVSTQRSTLHGGAVFRRYALFGVRQS